MVQETKQRKNILKYGNVQNRVRACQRRVEAYGCSADTVGELQDLSTWNCVLQGALS